MEFEFIKGEDIKPFRQNNCPGHRFCLLLKEFFRKSVKLNTSVLSSVEVRLLNFPIFAIQEEKYILEFKLSSLCRRSTVLFLMLFTDQKTKNNRQDRQ